MSDELVEAIRDAIFMFKDIEKARQLPGYADVQQQYVALGKKLEQLVDKETVMEEILMAPNDVRGLGNYMRHIGMRLTSDKPMSFQDAHQLISYMDEGYAAAVLIRLRERGIAFELKNYTYIRGPRWNEAAKMYNWEE